MRSIVILVGNGLGLGVNQSVFSLSSAMRLAWRRLSEDERLLLAKCLKPSELDGPLREDDLVGIHEIWNASRAISNVVGSFHETFLTKQGSELPYIANYYTFQVASHFHKVLRRLDSEKEFEVGLSFVTKFAGLIKKISKKYSCNLATLNYDPLLYRELVGLNYSSVSGRFNDGFKHKTFRGWGSDNWYMHLHGSPLFLHARGEVYKLDRRDHASISNMSFSEWKKKFGWNFHFPIILNRSKRKLEWILEDSLLKFYFDIFVGKVEQASDIFVFGYGARDHHVNEVILNWLATTHESSKLYFFYFSAHGSSNSEIEQEIAKTYGNNKRVSLIPYGTLDAWCEFLENYIIKN